MARSRSSFTMRCGNSSRAASSSTATSRRRAICSGVSDPRPARRSLRSSVDGGSTNTRTASGRLSRTWRAPWTSISSTTPRSGAVELGAQRAVAVTGVFGVFDEVAAAYARVEVLGAQEVVVAAVHLPRPGGSRGGGYGEREPFHAVEEALDERALADAGGPGDDEDRRYRRRKDTSSLRCRSDRPPIVLLGEIRQCVRIRFTFTRPYFGTARSRSKTLAVSR